MFLPVKSIYRKPPPFSAFFEGRVSRTNVLLVIHISFATSLSIANLTVAMGFLQRSKSAAVVEQVTKKKKNGSPPESKEIVEPIEEGKKSSSSGDRPSIADRTSFSRPRTANAAIGRTTEVQHPCFKIDLKAGNEMFSFPMPSPRISFPKSAVGQVASSSSREPEVPAIGLAIGSPSQAGPWDELINNDFDADLMPAPLCPTRPAPTVPEHPDLELRLNDIKKKKTQWKNLGALFSRKPAKVNSEQPVTQKQEESKLGLHHQRSPSMSRTQARFEARAEADMASFTQRNQPKLLRSPSMIQKEGLSPMFRCIQGIPEDSAWVDDLRKDSPLSMMSTNAAKPTKLVEAVAVPGAPAIVLDLPDPKFERYSIMFQKVLEETKPSLLERRQSRLKRNASVKKLELAGKIDEYPVVPRLEVNGIKESGAVSPGMGRSLSAKIGKKMLSPVTEVFSSLHRPRPKMQRAKTVATTTGSPLTTSSLSPNPMLSAKSVSGGFVMPPTPMTITTISDNGSIEIISNHITRRENDKGEPSWDMMTSLPLEEYKPQLRMNSPVDLEKQIVQVSVAKRISVTKAVTQVRKSFDIKPLKPKVVELSKDRASTFVVIESIAE